ncbi:hypothetical protein PIB30_073653 [Stylosanthes scabra]|uniref:Retrotransposon gag domain-containing protein n=1 Tax=Stylosanthes scabra TaxID=79078 RepID=A0ABU6UNA0_9FABA|nr:hypothetical protein [Stylosanthes scabra]
MTVAEYTSKFEDLCHFSRICQGAPESYEGWKCLRYHDGLRNDIKCAVAPFEIKNFVELVNKSQVVENCNKRIKETPEGCKDDHRQGRGVSFAPREQSFQRSGYDVDVTTQTGHVELEWENVTTAE